MPTKLRYYNTFLASTTATSSSRSDACYMPDDIAGGTFTLICTAVNSATTPTLNVAYEVTPDNGTTKIAVARHAQLTGAAKDCIHLSFAPWLQAGSTTTPAYTGGALYANVAWSHIFYIYYTIGGTSPSFTFEIHFIGYRMPMLGQGV